MFRVHAAGSSYRLRTRTGSGRHLPPRPFIGSSSVTVFRLRVPRSYLRPCGNSYASSACCGRAKVSQGDVPYQYFEGHPSTGTCTLTDPVKAVNTTMMCCVSRSQDEELELDP